jgi:hypothetical protein
MIDGHSPVSRSAVPGLFLAWRCSSEIIGPTLTGLRRSRDGLHPPFVASTRALVPIHEIDSRRNDLASSSSPSLQERSHRYGSSEKTGVSRRVVA